VSGYLEEWHVCQLKCSLVELEIDWLLCQWVPVGMETHLKLLKLTLRHNPEALDRVVSKDLTQVD
jgi:hypothetical protein